MLNDKQERELAYIVTIDDILPIEGADKVELAVVGGWTIMVQKEQFKPGDYAVYFEIDSKVPETEPFAFLAQKHYRVKTQKYFKGTVISQGLLMALDDFVDIDGRMPAWLAVLRINMAAGKDINHTFLTKELGVVYADPQDNIRKGKGFDKYKVMAQRNADLFKHQPFRWLMRRGWGKKFLYKFFGKRSQSKRCWPAWVQKTDEERVQNMPWILTNKEPWVVTEKIDGTSTTFTIRRKKGILKNKFDFYVCSRNVVFDKPDKECYYDNNVYLEMAEKYEVKERMINTMKAHPEWDWMTIQGETYGGSIQKRDYSIKKHDFAAFNLFTSDRGRWNSVEAAEFLVGIPFVPILKEEYVLPDTIAELLEYAEGNSIIDGKPREGLVFRSQDGTKSFKAVSNAYLLKYHQ